MKKETMCIACGKKKAVRHKVDGVVTLCEACNRQRLRKGVVKASIESSNTMAKLAMRATKESCVNIYDTATMKEIMQPVVSIKCTKVGNNIITVTESDPMSFFNKRTQDYNMMNGDKEMMKKVAGFRITDVVEDKYLKQAFILSEAINEQNQIVCTDGISLGETLNNMPPAIDIQIAKMIGYDNTGKAYRACMKSLLASGVIFKYEMEDSIIKQRTTIYYFNPVFQCAGKGVSPSLFFMFFESFQLMAQKNKEFKFRFQQMAKYAFKWMMDKRDDFKQLQADYNEGKITDLDAAKGATEIFSKIADSYKIPVRLETKVDVDTTGMGAFDSIMTKANSNIKFSNVTNLTQDIEEDDFLNELDMNIAKQETIQVTTYADLQRTVTVNGRAIPVPPNMPKVLHKVNIPTKTATVPRLNYYGFEEEEPINIPEQFK